MQNLCKAVGRDDGRGRLLWGGRQCYAFCAALQAYHRHWRLRSFQLCWGLPPMQHSADFKLTRREHVLIPFVEFAERMAGMVVVDAFCGVGGNAVHFAQRCKHVIGVDICASRLALAAQNARVYGVADRLDLICSDYFDLRGQLKANFNTACLLNRQLDFLSVKMHDTGSACMFALLVMCPSIAEAQCIAVW